MKKIKNAPCDLQDELKTHYESFGEKWESTQELHKNGMAKFIESKGVNSNLKVVEVFLVNDDHYVVKLYGGLNGNGEWSKYLDDIKNIIDSTPSYVIKLVADVPDDVWTLYIGLEIVKAE